MTVGFCAENHKFAVILRIAGRRYQRQKKLAPFRFPLYAENYTMLPPSSFPI